MEHKMEALVAVEQTERGWVARMDHLGLAGRAPTQEEAVRQVRETATLVERLVLRWREERARRGR